MKKWVMLVLLLQLGAATLTGCGQKGPLYLPDQPPKKQLVQDGVTP